MGNFTRVSNLVTQKVIPDPDFGQNLIFVYFRNQTEKAAISLTLLRGENYSKQPELDEILEVLEKEANEVSTFQDKIEKLKSPSVFKPLLMITILFILQVQNFHYGH